MVIVHAASAVRAALFGLTLGPFSRRRERKAPPLPCDATLLDPAQGASLSGMFEHLPLAILLVAPDGCIRVANARAQALFGHARYELIGMPVDRLMPDLRQKGGAAHCGAMLIAYRKDRTQFPADVMLGTMHEDGMAHTLAVVIDRTGRDELQRNRQELAHLTRVSMLGELAASLGHELNQPLTAILSNAQAAQRFMGREPVDLDEVRDILSDLVADTNRASEILRRIRALVKKGELELAPLSIAGVIDDVALLVHGDAIQRSLRVTLDIDTNLPLVRGDKIQLQQVVLNLLLNAFDAMEGLTTPRVVTVSATCDGDASVRVSVCDQGHGLPDALADQLFKPFCTSKRDGLGLGLSISRSIVEMHGGSIRASNNAQHGATFSFTLPTADAPVTRARAAP
jgi:two-component system, LuxR family, sensor kinase FixL